MKILLIEDEIALAKKLQERFMQGGFIVDWLDNGEAGERRIFFHHSDYDVVILDLLLPGKSGQEICRSVREQSIDIPILVLSALSSPEDKAQLIDAGADDYLGKPFVFAELRARIKALMRRPNAMTSEELQCEDIRLNVTSRKVYRGSEEVPLTLKEFAMLEYLLRHPGQVLEREQLLARLWDFAYDGFSNVVDVHVKNLRKKLGDRGWIIETVRGVGYRLQK